MAFKVRVGEADFAALRNEGAYYVDKTEFIYELVQEANNETSLFTRPRRFGKTLMTSMLENFFNIEKDSATLFSGLAVTKHEDFCKEWMNRRPVLSISFKDAGGGEFEVAYAKLQNVIADVCKKYQTLDSRKEVNSFDVEVFNRLQGQTGTEADVQNSLKTIMRMMNAVYGKKVVLLIDEYDVPLAQASEHDDGRNGFYAKMPEVVKGLTSVALKDNEFLEFAVVTGCLRIAKESIFTGTNNFASYSVLDDQFSEYFGFTEREVSRLLELADRKEAASEMKEWYDGYVFGNSRVYCPWDVMNHVSALRYKRDSEPKNYWKNTSHNGVLLSFVKRAEFDVADKFETLLNGKTIRQTISDELTYDALHSSEENLWSVLPTTGYVTKADPSEVGETTTLRIPNKEIASIFEDSVVRYFVETVDVESIGELTRALWNRDEARATDVLSALLWNTISYNDYHEDYYHAFLAGVFVGRGYSVESNKEKGLGRPDVLLKDRKNRRAIIIEAKKSSKEQNLDKDCDEALKQIVEKKYAEGLAGYEQILYYGVAFFQKRAKVKALRNEVSA